MFKSVGNFFKSLFSALLRIFKGFIQDAFDEASKLVIAEFKDFAVATVTLLAKTDLSSEEKRKEAFRQIKEELKKSGKDVGDSIINSLVELAYQYYKNNVKENG